MVGPLVYKATLAKFSRSFALAGRSGVPIQQALALVAEVVENAYLGARIMGMREGIERGESILRTAVNAGVFDPVVLQMVAVGEETGEMHALMAEIADMYEREVNIEVDGLAAKAEPLLLVLMGSLVLVLALGVFLPMWDMVGAARGVKRPMSWRNVMRGSRPPARREARGVPRASPRGAAALHRRALHPGPALVPLRARA